MPIHAYLTFTGNCREALEFYQGCFGGELSVQTVGDTPASGEMDSRMRACVVLGILRGEDFQLYGTDMVPETGRTVGNAVSLFLHCGSNAELVERYDLLSVGGRRIHEAEAANGGVWTGTLVDRFGVRWILFS